MNTSRIIYPIPLLSSYVKYFWILNTDSTNTIQTIPSGCIHLVFHRGNNLHFANGAKQPRNFIRGQLSKPGSLSPHGHINMIAVVFHPLGMVPFLPFPTDHLYNRYVDMEGIEDAGLKNLARAISSEKNPLRCIKKIEQFFSDRLNGFNNYNYSRIFSAIQLLKEQVETDISALANHVCLGYRHFKREFTKYAGMNPKEYQRVIRFQKALYSMQKNPDINITELIETCGFYDQSHLVKDFKLMTDCTPTEYLFSRKPHSTFFSDECRLNLIKSDQVN